MNPLELQSSVHTQNQERQGTKRGLVFAAEQTWANPGKRPALGMEYFTSQGQLSTGTLLLLAEEAGTESCAHPVQQCIQKKLVMLCRAHLDLWN